MHNRCAGTVLVLGARQDSLGAEVAAELNEHIRWCAVTAGISGQETHVANLLNTEGTYELFEYLHPQHVVCTVGVNNGLESGYLDGLPGWYAEHFVNNVLAPMNALAVFERWANDQRGDDATAPPRHYAVISSNSAHIPRSGSAAYCASKAALSMAVRVKAREYARSGAAVITYAYEPGLLAGTPMTQQTADAYDGPLHRMPGVVPGGLSTRALARMIADNLCGGIEMNGCTFRVDAGEI